MNLPKRKPTRLRDYDYSQNGAYFITICTHNKEYLFGNIVGCGDFDAPKMLLSKTGKIVRKYIDFMSAKYKHIKIDKYVIMPNHLHFLIRIDNEENGLSQSAKPYNNELSKFVSLFKRYVNRECSMSIFQRSFHDHIIRGKYDYQKLWEYIDSNPIKWKSDCFYSDEM